MNPIDEQQHAAFILQVLLGYEGDLRNPDWRVVLGIAARNTVLVRLTDTLSARRTVLPDWFVAAAQAERHRVETSLDVILGLGKACSQNETQFLCLKTFHHYPDMGHDIDLLVRSRSIRLEEVIGLHFRATACQSRLSGWLTGTSRYVIEGCASPIDLYQGRLGWAGENKAFADALIANCVQTEMRGLQFAVPSREDQLILQAVQKICERLHFRLADVVHTVSTVKRPGLNWDYIIRTTRQLGVFGALSGYLTYIDQIHERLSGQPLLSSDVRKRLLLNGWGQAVFRRGSYRFSTGSVVPRVYAEKFFAQLTLGEWEAAARLLLVPLLVAAATGRRLVQTGN